jgi:hypothetical protein
MFVNTVWNPRTWAPENGLIMEGGKDFFLERSRRAAPFRVLQGTLIASQSEKYTKTDIFRERFRLLLDAELACKPIYTYERHP